MRAVTVRFLCAVTLALAGCSLVVDVDADLPPCLTDADCATGARCVAGACAVQPMFEPGAGGTGGAAAAGGDTGAGGGGAATGGAGEQPDATVMPPADTGGAGGADPTDCVPTAESCDGVDNDCDTRVDEGAGGVRVVELAAGDHRGPRHGLTALPGTDGVMVAGVIDETLMLWQVALSDGSLTANEPSPQPGLYGADLVATRDEVILALAAADMEAGRIVAFRIEVGTNNVANYVLHESPSVGYPAVSGSRDGTVAVAWSDIAEVGVALIGPNGPTGVEWIEAELPTDPTVAWLGDRVVVAWMEGDPETVRLGDVFGGRSVELDGAPTFVDRPEVRPFADGRVLVSWQGDSGDMRPRVLQYVVNGALEIERRVRVGVDDLAPAAPGFDGGSDAGLLAAVVGEARRLLLVRQAGDALEPVEGILVEGATDVVDAVVRRVGGRFAVLFADPSALKLAIVESGCAGG
jgi:hypothetical protein